MDGVTTITGRTSIALHLAYPAAHVRTPSFFNRRCAERGLDAALVPWEVRPSALPATLLALRGVSNLAGVIVTMPHKGPVADLCDELVGDAALLRACNAARRLPDGRFVGTMHDGTGFVAGLRREGHDIAGRRTLLAGAGGAATAVALALVAGGVERLDVQNRSGARAAAMLDIIRRAHPGAALRFVTDPGPDYDLVVNGTPLGMHDGDALPVAAAVLRPGALVAEMVMQPDVTPLLREAERLGAVPHRGVHMITEQMDLLIDALFAPSSPQGGETN